MRIMNNIFIYTLLISYSLIIHNGHCIRLSFSNGKIGHIGLPYPFSLLSSLRGYKISNKLGNMLMPYTIRISTHGKFHYPKLKFGRTEYKFANSIDALPDSYPRDTKNDIDFYNNLNSSEFNLVELPAYDHSTILHDYYKQIYRHPSSYLRQNYYDFDYHYK